MSIETEHLNVWICCKPWELNATDYESKKSPLSTSEDEETGIVEAEVFIVPNGCIIADEKVITNILPLVVSDSKTPTYARYIFGDGTTTVYELRLSYVPIRRGSITISTWELAMTEYEEPDIDKLNSLDDTTRDIDKTIIAGDDAAHSTLGSIIAVGGSGVSGTINYNGGLLRLNFSTPVASGIMIDIVHKSESSRVITPPILIEANRELQCFLDDFPLTWRQDYIETDIGFTLHNEIIFDWDTPRICALKRLSLFYETVMRYPARLQVTGRRYRTGEGFILYSQQADFDSKVNNLCIAESYAHSEFAPVPGSKWHWSMHLQNYPEENCGSSNEDEERTLCHLGTEITMGQIYFGTRTYTGGVVKACCLTTGEAENEGHTQRIVQYNDGSLPNNWVGSRVLRWIVEIEGQKWLIMPMGFESYIVGNWACVIKLSLPSDPYVAKTVIDSTTLNSEDYNEVFATGTRCEYIDTKDYGVIYYNENLRIIPNNFYGGFLSA